MSRKLSVELIGKIISRGKDDSSLARTMGKRLSKKDKEQLSNYVTKHNVIEKYNLSQVKNLYLLGIEFTEPDLFTAADNRDIGIVKFLQEKYPGCVIKSDLLYYSSFTLNIFKTLLECTSKQNLKKKDFLALAGYYIVEQYNVPSDDNDEKLIYLINRNPYKYKFKLKDIFMSENFSLYIEALSEDDFDGNPETYFFPFVLDIIEIIDKTDYKISTSDVKWLFTKYIGLEGRKGAFVVLPKPAYIALVKQVLKLLKMEKMYNKIIRIRKS